MYEQQLSTYLKERSYTAILPPSNPYGPAPPWETLSLRAGSAERYYLTTSHSLGHYPLLHFTASQRHLTSHINVLSHHMLSMLLTWTTFLLLTTSPHAPGRTPSHTKQRRFWKAGPFLLIPEPKCATLTHSQHPYPSSSWEWGTKLYKTQSRLIFRKMYDRLDMKQGLLKDSKAASQAYSPADA